MIEVGSAVDNSTLCDLFKVANTGGIRPGAIKAATGTEVTPAEARCLTGAAIAQHEFGCAIITHTENSRNGDVQQDIFESVGAELARVLIGHQDEQPDVAPIRKLAERGTFVGIDRIGLELLAPDVRRADHVATLVREGFTSQVCLSQDHICTMTAPRSPMWTPPEARERRAAMAEEIAWQVTKRPYTYVLTDFVPMLRDRGVTDADLETIFVDNPRRLLTGS